MIIKIFFVVLFLSGCAAVDPSGDVWDLSDKTVKVKSCEDAKKRDPEIDC